VVAEDHRMSAIRIALAVGIALVVCQVVAATSPARAEEGSAADPVILSPEDGARVPREGVDPPCPDRGPCPKVFLKGRVPEGLWPFIGVAPLSMPPKIWIQPAVEFVKKDKTFESLIFVGSERDGSGERFHLFVFACAEKDHFRRGQILTGVPEDCRVSDPVSVLRTQ
jgi:hypothetical protein